jgi:hypothetical protein
MISLDLYCYSSAYSTASNLAKQKTKYPEYSKIKKIIEDELVQ